ncbi:MAG: dihydrofolate reductase, partial [Flavobacterium sp.]
IGGAEIYKSTLDVANRIYLTTVHKDFEADAYFPALNTAQWKVLKSEKHEADEKNAIAYTFSLLERN